VQDFLESGLLGRGQTGEVSTQWAAVLGVDNAFLCCRCLSATESVNPCPGHIIRSERQVRQRSRCVFREFDYGVGEAGIAHALGDQLVRGMRYGVEVGVGVDSGGGGPTAFVPSDLGVLVDEHNQPHRHGTQYDVPAKQYASNFHHGSGSPPPLLTDASLDRESPKRQENNRQPTGNLLD
jgi:hypothetical protein